MTPLLLLLACSAKSDSPSADDTAPTEETGTVPLDISCQLEGDHGPDGDLPLDVEVVVSGLEVPWSLAWLPDGRMLINERPGRLRLVDEDGSLVTIHSIEESWTTEGGLLGLALHPDFEDNRYIYVYFTQDDENRVERWVLAEDARSVTVDAVILEDIPAATFHNGGRLRFGPDGMLYIGTGDARVTELSQQFDSLAGKLLRIHPDGGVPEDALEGELTWLWGIRNTQAFDWRDDGRIVLSDHGPSGEDGRYDHDELNVAEPGANLGWPTIYACEEAEGLQPPAMTWDEAMPPGGLAIYTGADLPELSGDVMVGVLGLDEGVGHLHRFRLSDDGNVEISERYLTDRGRLREVAMGPDGHLYVTESNCGGRGDCPEIGDSVLRVVRR